MSAFWYLATPYSKYPSGIEAAFRLAVEARGFLLKHGIPTFSPIIHSHPVAVQCDLDPLDHTIWLPSEAPIMMVACGLIMLMAEGWRESVGMKYEQDDFTWRKLPIVFMEPFVMPRRPSGVGAHSGGVAVIRILQGDCRAVLATLPDASVHCCVTSPPYWDLRDYGTAQWDGGDAACDHVAGNARNDVTTERLAERAAQYGTGTGNGSKVTTIQFRDICGKCGARRIDAQIGLEKSPDAYVAEMVAVFREVRRVLRDDGTLWLNLGDGYNQLSGNNGQAIHGRDNLA